MARAQAKTPPAVAKKVQGVLVDFLKVKPGEVTPASALVEDLGMDSLVAAELLIEIENAFDVEFGLEAVEELMAVQTVGDLSAVVAARTARGANRAAK
ncbi:MAG: Phosphopantetheine attachment site [Chloroflexota bacterium]|jgi:acyl carrier protein|nr:Phosphopantetheine attachment site [Chloroflexota bacterium]